MVRRDVCRRELLLLAVRKQWLPSLYVAAANDDHDQRRDKTV